MIFLKGHNGEIGDPGISGVPGDRVSSADFFFKYISCVDYVYILC